MRRTGIRARVLMWLVFIAVLILWVSSISANSGPAHILHGTPDPEATPQVSAERSQVNDPTYYRDVEPIFQRHCAACHQAGGIGYASFDITDLDLISDSEAASYIANVTGIGYMPPWPPGPLSLPMEHERRLTEAEIALIARWAQNGALLGDEADRQAAPPPTNIPRITPDVVLTMTEAYTPTGELLDDYRCFLVDPGFAEDRLVTGMDFQPGNAEISHHALFFIATPDMIDEAQARDGADGRPGWQCFGGTGLRSAQSASPGGVDLQALSAGLSAQGVELATFNQALAAYRSANPGARLNMAALQVVLRELGVDVQQLIADMDLDVARITTTGMTSAFGGWVPGSVPVTSPANTGILVRRGSQIVIQMHYNLYYSDGSDQSTLLLETAPYTDDMTALSTPSLVAPVEIPCPAGVEGVGCRRAATDARSSNGLLMRCDQSLETYASNTAENAYGYCDYPIAYEGWILGVGPHMHELGKAARIVLNPEAPDETILIDIPNWDFHWQGQYSFVEPVEIQPGDVVRVECWWDNSEGIRYVVWGEGTQDEMCFHFTRILVREPGKTLADFGYTVHTVMSDHHQGHTAGDAHDHEELVNVTDDMAIPVVALTVTPTSAGGYYIQLTVENFDFAPEAVDGAHVPGQGHAHLYVNGEKITRLYGTEYYLDAVPSGDVEIRVTLNSNDHRTYAHHGAIIQAVVLLNGQ